MRKKPESVTNETASSADSSSKWSRKNYSWLVVICFLAIIGLLAGYHVLVGKKQQAEQEAQSRSFFEMNQSIQSSRQTGLVANILLQAQNELGKSNERSLSDNTIAGIAALSQSLKPYRVVRNGALSDRELSPERAQLLLSLLFMNLDDKSIRNFKQKVSFRLADLRDADLTGQDLSEINLEGADLSHAILKQANFNSAQMDGVVLFGADLAGASFYGANLHRANGASARMEGTDMRSANLNGASFPHAQMRKVDLRKAACQWTNFQGALFEDVDGDSADFLASRMDQAVFLRTRFTNANIFKISLGMAVFSDVDLQHAVVIETCLEDWKNFKVDGIEAVANNYHIIVDSSIAGKPARHLLEK